MLMLIAITVLKMIHLIVAELLLYLFLYSICATRRTFAANYPLEELCDNLRCILNLLILRARNFFVTSNLSLTPRLA